MLPYNVTVMMLLLHASIVSFGGLTVQHSYAMNIRACRIHFVIACLCQRMDRTLAIMMDSCSYTCKTRGGNSCIVG